MRRSLEQVIDDPASASTDDLRSAISIGRKMRALAPSKRSEITSITMSGSTESRSVTLDAGSRGRIDATIRALELELSRRLSHPATNEGEVRLGVGRRNA